MFPLMTHLLLLESFSGRAEVRLTLLVGQVEAPLSAQAVSAVSFERIPNIYFLILHFYLLLKYYYILLTYILESTKIFLKENRSRKNKN